MKPTTAAVLFAAATLTAIAAAAYAQAAPAGTVFAPATGNAPLTIDMHPSSADPPPPPPTPTPQAPAGPTIITIGPDGKPVQPSSQPSQPNGLYYEDDSDQNNDQTVQLHAGPTPELHVVRSGDTLWDICWYYFNDPWQWPKVWSYNPQITNPHWIYPGDLVRLVPHGMTAQIAPSPMPTDVEASKAGPSVNSEPAPAKSFGVELKQLAFVDQDQIDTSITIDGSVEAKAMLSDGDTVYLRYPAGKPPKVGETYSIYTIGNEVTRPGTEDKVGAYVNLIGELQVQSVKKDKRATAVITRGVHEIERGALVGPLQRKLATVPPARSTVDAQGTVVAMLAGEQLIGTGEVVFIDLGEKSGLAVGNRMYVVRRGDPIQMEARTSVGQDDRRFPAHALGEIVVVQVGKKVSIGLVTLAVQELGVGDLVMMQANQ